MDGARDEGKGGSGRRTRRSADVVLAVLAALSGPLLAQDGADGGREGAPGRAESPDPAESAPQGGAEDGPGGAMIPRSALVDMTRAQSRVICASESFLGCMAFDGKECTALSEAAISQCLMTLPEQIDPRTLDQQTLERCPVAIYERAGHDESKAQACFEQAVDDS